MPPGELVLLLFLLRRRIRGRQRRLWRGVIGGCRFDAGAVLEAGRDEEEERPAGPAGGRAAEFGIGGGSTEADVEEVEELGEQGKKSEGEEGDESEAELWERTHGV